MVWHPTFPYKSSLTGQTCQELADQYTADTGNGWTEPIGQYGKFEWAVDVYKRMTDIDDKELFPAVVQATKLETINGPVDFTVPGQAGDCASGAERVQDPYRRRPVAQDRRAASGPMISCCASRTIPRSRRLPSSSRLPYA